MNAAEKTKMILAATKIGRIAWDLITGQREDAATAAKEILGMLTDMIPVAELAPFLTDSQRTLIDLAADVDEELKLEGKDP